MAAGLLVLAETLGDRPDARRYRQHAYAILTALIAGYTTASEPEAEGLLLHGASNVNTGKSDAMLPYGDYFFIEALLRALGKTHGYW